ncbi:MAG TPA: hypothetical protein VJH75_01765 [Patescibacteria group bacterium]|nr:hypothetical protein [Patescibacteria group bacterium]
MPPDRAPQTFNPELATQEIADLEAAVFRHRDNKRLQQIHTADDARRFVDEKLKELMREMKAEKIDAGVMAALKTKIYGLLAPAQTSEGDLETI